MTDPTASNHDILFTKVVAVNQIQANFEKERQMPSQPTAFPACTNLTACVTSVSIRLLPSSDVMTVCHLMFLRQGLIDLKVCSLDSFTASAAAFRSSVYRARKAGDDLSSIHVMSAVFFA
ncbi:unnamed protein product [Clavelina lepadiformis]|uniref:Uncharacterized protein n=1 Tax=Clavelina lepadiformis TaxID=159417 RepID=A0ABP0GCZ8_CLALP